MCPDAFLDVVQSAELDVPVSLDAGQQLFQSARRYLEIWIRPGTWRAAKSIMS
jgi:hypothetical protein